MGESAIEDGVERLARREAARRDDGLRNALETPFALVAIQDLVHSVREGEKAFTGQELKDAVEAALK